MTVENRVTPAEQLPALRGALDSKGFVRIIEVESRLHTINEILHVTSKPLI